MKNNRIYHRDDINYPAYKESKDKNKQEVIDSVVTVLIIIFSLIATFFIAWSAGVNLFSIL